MSTPDHSSNSSLLPAGTSAGATASTSAVEGSQIALLDPELRSLFALLDDPDPHVAQAVEERLRSRGARDVMAPLVAFLQGAPNDLARERAQRITLEFNTRQVTRQFEELSLRLDDPADRDAFEDGLFLIARYGDPLIKVSEYHRQLTDFAEMLNDRIGIMTSALEVLSEVNRFFFEELRFKGNQAKFIEPENSYINRVVDRRTGIPISLATVYLLVTQYRLRLPFSGASAPGHFLIRYDGLRAEPLFIDAFNGGVVLRERDIKRYLDSSGLPFNKSFLEPASPRAILLRMIRNLIIVFNELGDREGRVTFEHFMRILAPDAEEGQAFLRGLDS